MVYASSSLSPRAVFPCGDSMVAIIDDREDVWGRCPNLVHVKPYVFFSGTSDINAPPPLVPLSASSSSSLPSTPTTPRPFFSGASQGSGVVPQGQPRPFKMRHISRQPRLRPSATRRQQPASDLTAHSHTAKGNGTPSDHPQPSPPVGTPSDHPHPSPPVDSGQTEHNIPSLPSSDLKPCGSNSSNDVCSIGSSNDCQSNDQDMGHEHFNVNVNSNNNNSKDRDGTDSGESGSDEEGDEGEDGGRGEDGGGEGTKGESKMEGGGGNGVSSSSSSGSSSESDESSSSGSSSAMDISQPPTALEAALETGGAEVPPDSGATLPDEKEENGMHTCTQIQCHPYTVHTCTCTV